MKKIIAICVATLLTLQFATACGKTEDTSKENNSSDTASVADVVESKADDSKEDANDASNDVSKITIESQTLGLDGVSNARQVGGYVGADGKTVKSNILLRTGKLSDATEGDLEKLEALNISTIIDFRTTTEIASAVDPEIEGVENINLKVMEETNDESEEETESTADDSTNDDTDKAVTQVYDNPAASLIGWLEGGLELDTMYTSLLDSEFSQKAYKSYFDTLLANEDGKAVLWHCTGGKDRAGTAAMLLLSALEVDRDTILRDFELTNDFNATQIEYMKTEAAKITDDEQLIEGVEILTGVKREYMEKAMEHLDKEYGSPMNYIVEVLGVTEDEIQQLQDMYLQ